MPSHLGIEAVLTTTRAVRKRLDFTKPVEPKVIEECLAAAQQAPNGGNLQTWGFVLITNGAKRTALANVYRKGFDIFVSSPIAAAMGYGQPNASPVQRRVMASIDYLVENLHRENLNPLEEARAYQRLQTEFQLRQEDVAQYVGKDRSSIANALRLLKLPQVLQEDLEAGRLTMGHARALLALESEEEQLRLRDQILAAGLSVRETEAHIRTLKRSAPDGRAKPSHFVVLEAALQQHFGTRVAIRPGRKHGKIEIIYTGEDDLHRLLMLLQLQPQAGAPEILREAPRHDDRS